MAYIDKKYKLEDLYVGMNISDKEQLGDIYDVWLILVKNENGEGYTIGFIGEETNVESDKLFSQGNKVCPVYNDSMELFGIERSDSGRGRKNEGFERTV